MIVKGKRRMAVIAVLASRGRSTGADIVLCAAREHGVTMSLDGALTLAVELEESGLAEQSDPHLDRVGRLRGTWKLTDAGWAVL